MAGAGYAASIRAKACRPINMRSTPRPHAPSRFLHIATPIAKRKHDSLRNFTAVRMPFSALARKNKGSARMHMQGRVTEATTLRTAKQIKTARIWPSPYQVNKKSVEPGFHGLQRTFTPRSGRPPMGLPAGISGPKRQALKIMTFIAADASAPGTGRQREASRPEYG